MLKTAFQYALAPFNYVAKTLHDAYERAGECGFTGYEKFYMTQIFFEEQLRVDFFLADLIEEAKRNPKHFPSAE